MNGKKLHAKLMQEQPMGVPRVSPGMNITLIDLLNSGRLIEGVVERFYPDRKRWAIGLQDGGQFIFDGYGGWRPKMGINPPSYDLKIGNSETSLSYAVKPSDDIAPGTKVMATVEIPHNLLDMALISIFGEAGVRNKIHELPLVMVAPMSTDTDSAVFLRDPQRNRFYVGTYR